MIIILVQFYVEFNTILKFPALNLCLTDRAYSRLSVNSFFVAPLTCFEIFNSLVFKDSHGLSMISYHVSEVDSDPFLHS